MFLEVLYQSGNLQALSLPVSSLWQGIVPEGHEGSGRPYHLKGAYFYRVMHGWATIPKSFFKLKHTVVDPACNTAQLLGRLSSLRRQADCRTCRCWSRAHAPMMGLEVRKHSPAVAAAQGRLSPPLEAVLLLWVAADGCCTLFAIGCCPTNCTTRASRFIDQGGVDVDSPLTGGTFKDDPGTAAAPRTAESVD